MSSLCRYIVLLSAAVSVLAVEAKPFDYHSVRGRQAVVQQKGIYEGEALQLRGTSRVQDMRGFGPAWSGDAHLLWMGEPGEVMETVFSRRKGQHLRGSRWSYWCPLFLPEGPTSPIRRPWLVRQSPSLLRLS